MTEKDWVMVPRKPTPEMIKAAMHVKRTRMMSVIESIRRGEDESKARSDAVVWEWVDMIAAAPTPPEACARAASIPAPSAVQPLTLSEGFQLIKKYGAENDWFGLIREIESRYAAPTAAPHTVLVTACCGRRECGGECGNEWMGMERVLAALPAVQPLTEEQINNGFHIQGGKRLNFDEVNPWSEDDGIKEQKS
jgi:hypothetical protein